MRTILTVAVVLLVTTAAIAQDKAGQKFIIEASVRNDVSPLRLSRRPRCMPPYPRPVARARSFSNPEGSGSPLHFHLDNIRAFERPTATACLWIFTLPRARRSSRCRGAGAHFVFDLLAHTLLEFFRARRSISDGLAVTCMPLSSRPPAPAYGRAYPDASGDRLVPVEDFSGCALSA